VDRQFGPLPTGDAASRAAHRRYPCYVIIRPEADFNYNVCMTGREQAVLSQPPPKRRSSASS